MGTSITVPEHIETRFSRRAPKDGFLPVQSMPVPSQRTPHAEIVNIEGKNKSTLTIPNYHIKLDYPSKVTVQREEEERESSLKKEKKVKKAPLTSRDFNNSNYQSTFHQENESSVWNSLSKQVKVRFKQVSNRRKMSTQYKSISVENDQVLDLKDITVINNKQDLPPPQKQSKQQTLDYYNSEPVKAQKVRIKLKAISTAEQLKGKKKRVHLYLENAENIYE